MTRRLQAGAATVPSLLEVMAKLRARAKSRFGTVAMARGERESEWVADLRQVVCHAQIPCSSPDDDLLRSLSIKHAAFTDPEWWGSLELWPDGPETIWLVRVPLLSAWESELVFALAPSDEQLHGGLTRLYSHWRLWRRVASRHRTSTGIPLPLQPVRWDELYLPDALLSDLRRTVEAFAVARPLYDSFHLPYRRGLLFHGPSGNGKTMTTRAIMTALGWPMILASNYVGRFDFGRLSYCGFGHTFKAAAEAAPAVLVFEDVDTLLHSQADLNEFLNDLDGFTAQNGVLVIATTNHPERLDAAIISRPSRFDRVYKFALPVRRERLRYLLHLFAGVLPESECEDLADRTKGFSMAFLRELFVSATLAAARRGDGSLGSADVRAAFALLELAIRGRVK